MKKFLVMFILIFALSSCGQKNVSNINTSEKPSGSGGNIKTETSSANFKNNKVKTSKDIKIKRKSKTIKITANNDINFCSYKLTIPEGLSEFNGKGYQLNDENEKIHDYMEISNKDNISINLYPRILNANLLTYTMSKPEIKERFEEIYLNNEHTYNKYINNIEEFDGTTIFNTDPEKHENYFSGFDFIINLNSEKVAIIYYNFAGNQGYGDLVFTAFSMARTRNCLMIINYQIASANEVQAIVDKYNKENPIGTGQNIDAQKMQTISQNLYKTIYSDLVTKNEKVTKNIELLKQIMINMSN